MRTIGLIGGMAWESTAEYYRLLNREVARRLGGHHNAVSLLYTVDFAAVERMQRDGDWAGAGRLLAEAAATVERGGAGLVLLCTNTMHRVAEDIVAAIDVPFLHIVDVTAAAVRAAGLDRVGLLGTRFTMEMDFYRDRMAEHGVEVLVPDAADRAVVHEVIYRELTHGIVTEESRAEYRRIVAALGEAGAGGVVLGCTEITLLIGPEDVALPVFDSTRLHVDAAVDLALS